MPKVPAQVQEQPSPLPDGVLTTAVDLRDWGDLIQHGCGMVLELSHSNHPKAISEWLHIIENRLDYVQETINKIRAYLQNKD